MSKQIKPSQSYIDEGRATALLEKWSPVLDYTSGNVGAIENENTRLNTAILLENQEQWCLRESPAAMNAAGVNAAGGATGAFAAYDTTNAVNAGANGGAVGNSDFYASGDARLPKILIPMIRRTFPELITNEIVGVQPMSGPVGLAFALRYRYESDSLGADGLDGKAFTSTARDIEPNAADGKEIGYQDLDTRFTGTSSAKLSGSGTVGNFDFVDADKGVAELLGNYELTGKIPQVVVQFEKTAVEAGTRRLAARWSVELEQDLKNMNGIDVDTELKCNVL